MAKSTCSTSSSSSYSSSIQSNNTSTSTSSNTSSNKSSSIGPFKSVTDRRKRLAANARERKRMHLLNQAYDRLRERLADSENKSKYDVLVQAKEYILVLAAMCENMDQKETPQSPPVNNNDTTISAPTIPSPMMSTDVAAAVAPINTPHNHNYHQPQLPPRFEPHHYQPHKMMTRFDQPSDYV